MKPVGRKHTKNIARKLGRKLITDDSSIGSNNGGSSKGELVTEDLVM